MRELGAHGTAFRLGWELRSRLGWLDDGEPPSAPERLVSRRIPFASADEVRALLDPYVDQAERDQLLQYADEACRGRIHCFSTQTVDFGQPIDWYLSPHSRARWPSDCAWAVAQRDKVSELSDVKHTWELGRFPHAYHFARAAMWHPSEARRLGGALYDQICDFDDRAPYGKGIHWASSQEIAFRLIAWLFGYATLLVGSDMSASAQLPSTSRIARALYLGALHTEQHIDFARYAVHNNHLLSEALLLLMAGVVLPDSADTTRFRQCAIDILEEQSDRQFYRDGGYIQQSHNYHRLALQVMLLASCFARSARIEPPRSWSAALERSIDFLFAQQNPADGSLPNYGFNDGALPLLLSSCAFRDFRPALQAANIHVRSERLYPPGPWDEEAAWLLGAAPVAAATLSTRERTSRSFGWSGHHVLRDALDPNSFATFRCGTLRDRFSQIDMLHVDLWWKGHNVLVDPGSYQYNGPEYLNAHFVRTESHNTVTVDGLDQMHHHRRFKVLYWTEAELVHFQQHSGYSLCVGQHHGYRRHPGRAVHRRSVLFVRPEIWVVLDHVDGEGQHNVRLHWLGGPFDHRLVDHSVVLHTPGGDFGVSIYDEHATPQPMNVVRGSNTPLGGWLSRHYSEKIPAPAMSMSSTAELPQTLISVIGPNTPQLELAHTAANARAAGPQCYRASCGSTSALFEVSDGAIQRSFLDAQL